MSLPVVILAGGLATRLRPLSEILPKSLIEIAGKPFIVHQIELLQRNGLKELTLCLGHLGELVEEYLTDDHPWGVSLRYSYDGPTLLGTGGALRKALTLLGESFFVLYGDSYLDCDYASIETAFGAQNKPGLMTIMKNDGKWDRSNIVYSNGQIIKYDKRTSFHGMNYIDYGIGVFKASAIAGYPAETYIDLETIYQDLIEGARLAAFEVRERFYEVGSQDGIQEFEAYIHRMNRQGKNTP